MRPLVLYHNDMDGLAAACVFAKYIGDDHPAGVGNIGDYRRVTYGDSLPDDIDNRDVYLMDFSFSFEQMRELAARSSRLIWIDHHKSKIPVFEDICKTTTIDPMSAFDVRRCGAALAWIQMFSGDMPEILKYVEDRDLWRWELPNSRAISAGMWAMLGKLHPSSGFLTMNPTSFIDVGEILLDAQEDRIRAAISQATPTTIDDYSALAVNAATDVSEIGHALCEGVYPLGGETGFQTAEVAIIYRFHQRARDGQGAWVHDLRSVSVDVSEIAKNRGGGGHENSAGFLSKIPWINEDRTCETCDRGKLDSSPYCTFAESWLRSFGCGRWEG